MCIFVVLFFFFFDVFRGGQSLFVGLDRLESAMLCR